MKCDICNGTGYQKDVYKIYFGDKLIGSTNMCIKCCGTGEVDWIENIVGKDISNLNVKTMIKKEKDIT